MGTKFGVVVVLCTILVMAFCILAIKHRVLVEDSARAEDAARTTSAGISAAVQAVFQNALDIVNTTHDDLIALRDGEISDPGVYDTVLKQMILSGSDRYGAWIVWDAADAPKAESASAKERRDSMGRFATYWHQNGMEMLRDGIPGEIYASDLYRTPRQSDQAYFLEPHVIDALNGDPTFVTSFSRPLEHSGKVVGVLAMDLKLDSITDALSSIDLPAGASITIVSSGGMVAMSTRKADTGKSLAAADPMLAPYMARVRRGDGTAIVTRGADKDLVSWNAIKVANAKSPWFLLMHIPEKSLLGRRSDDGVFLFFLAAIAVLSTLTLVLLAMNRLVSTPLRRLSALMRGNTRELFVAVPYRGRRDEVGDIARAIHMALHDGLTGLPNRILFDRHLKQAFAERAPEEAVVVLCLDLDRFKAVNDTFGHSIGDQLLASVARRLSSCLTSSNSIVARLGGDEFAIVAIGPCGFHFYTELAEQLVAEICHPFEVSDRQIVIGCSIGIAMATAEDDFDSILKNADFALYQSKATGRGGFRLFEPAMKASIQNRLELELDLRTALAEKQFELHYQPLVAIESGVICGFEALLRWKHPSRGLIMPTDFIPLAEETGEIETIGSWVIGQACRDAATWPANVRVAVNLSPVQFRSGRLASHVVAALAASGLRPQRLELEITETLLLQDTDLTLTILHQLRDLGVRIAMDDFGVGYSSLSYLQKFPFDKIKIDRSFVDNLCRLDGAALIVRAVVGLAKGLGMSTTAEGVETVEQFELLKIEGCTEAQGYLFSPPRPIDAIASLIADRYLIRNAA